MARAQPRVEQLQHLQAQPRAVFCAPRIRWQPRRRLHVFPRRTPAFPMPPAVRLRPQVATRARTVAMRRPTARSWCALKASSTRPRPARRCCEHLRRCLLPPSPLPRPLRSRMLERGTATTTQPSAIAGTGSRQLLRLPACCSSAGKCGLVCATLQRPARRQGTLPRWKGALGTLAPVAWETAPGPQRRCGPTITPRRIPTDAGCSA